MDWTGPDAIDVIHSSNGFYDISSGQRTNHKIYWNFKYTHFPQTDVK